MAIELFPARCMLLKDPSSPDMPTDLFGYIYMPVDFDDLDGVGDAVEQWVTRGLMLDR